MENVRSFRVAYIRGLLHHGKYFYLLDKKIASSLRGHLAEAIQVIIVIPSTLRCHPQYNSVIQHTLCHPQRTLCHPERSRGISFYLPFHQ
jgi:hypothetical protein